jgi:hypothetical protein
LEQNVNLEENWVNTCSDVENLIDDLMAQAIEVKSDEERALIYERLGDLQQILDELKTWGMFSADMA